MTRAFVPSTGGDRGVLGSKDFRGPYSFPSFAHPRIKLCPRILLVFAINVAGSDQQVARSREEYLDDPLDPELKLELDRGLFCLERRSRGLRGIEDPARPMAEVAQTGAISPPSGHVYDLFDNANRGCERS